MTAKNHAPRWMDVYDEIQDGVAYKKYIYEEFNGPTPYDAIPKQESFSVVDWYWDDRDQRHYTGLDTVEQWYTRQERVANGWVDLLDTNGNEPVKSNMEAQLRQAEMYTITSHYAEVFLKSHEYNYVAFVELWQDIQHARLRKEVKELATRNAVQAFASNGKLLSFKEYVKKANEHLEKVKARATGKRGSVKPKPKGSSKRQVQLVRKSTSVKRKTRRSA